MADILSASRGTNYLKIAHNWDINFDNQTADASFVLKKVFTVPTTRSTDGGEVSARRTLKALTTCNCNQLK